MKASHPPRDTRKRVLIVDDHPLLREGLGKVINQQEDLVVCGEAGDAPSGSAAVEKCRPDIAVVDISLEEGSGLELIKSIHARHPKLPVVALSMHHEDLYAERALRAGASGYVLKREPVSAVIAALRTALGGQTAVSQSIVSRILNRRLRGEAPKGSSPTELLSDRELDIYRLFGEGRCTREIAAKLRLAVSTVESYRGSIKTKLNLRTGTELVSSAARFVATESLEVGNGCQVSQARPESARGGPQGSKHTKRTSDTPVRHFPSRA